MYTVNRETGGLIWRYQIGSPVMSSPIVVGNQVIVGASDGADSSIQRQGWQGPVDGPDRQGGPCLTCGEGRHGLHRFGRRPHVRNQGGDRSRSSGSSGSAGKLRRRPRSMATACTWAETRPIFYCLKLEDGTVDWTFGTGGPIVYQALLTDDHIVFGSLRRNDIRIEQGIGRGQSVAIPAIVHIVGEDAIYGELDQMPSPTRSVLSSAQP